MVFPCCISVWVLGFRSLEGALRLSCLRVTATMSPFLIHLFCYPINKTGKERKRVDECKQVLNECRYNCLVVKKKERGL
ncbi:MAG: hypothetical protein J3R72DRAFT_443498 [Linnemannia gamsii]|nr:MAG: hypothetical protein J3R72DRAFT_443498 [Linnemannia gamsii]